MSSLRGLTMLVAVCVLSVGISVVPFSQNAQASLVRTASNVSDLQLVSSGTAASLDALTNSTSVYEPLAPARLVDTRAGEVTIDGVHQGAGAFTGSRDFKVTGRAGVPPSGVGAVVLNVTVTRSEGNGYTTIYPKGNARPTTSNLNYGIGRTVPNLVIAKVGTGGNISIFNSAVADVIVDVAGWMPLTGGFTPLDPIRLVDTRPGASTTDGQHAGEGIFSGSREVKVAGRGGIPSSGVAAVALNVTVTGGVGNGFTTLFPSGGASPLASNLNFGAGETKANMVIVKVGSGNLVSIFNSISTNIVIDVAGWFPVSSDFESIPPSRLVDTRLSGTTIDAIHAGEGRYSGSREFRVVGRGGVPQSGVGAVVLNITVTSSLGNSYTTVFPAGTPVPNASNLNYGHGETTANLVVAKVNENGLIAVFNFVPTDVVIDVAGWIPGNVEGLVYMPKISRELGAMTDQIGVWTCKVPGAVGPIHDSVAVANWAQGEADAYFGTESRGRYHPIFTALGSFDLTVGADPMSGCLARGKELTGSPYTNVLVVNTTGDSGGLGGSGTVSIDGSSGATSNPPSQSSRGLVIGGGSYWNAPSRRVLTHEMGHALGFPHSYFSATYDNYLDVMGAPLGFTCPGRDGMMWSCWAQHTLAFNRFAAGWIDSSEVFVQRKGSRSLRLAGPDGTDGTQLVVAPSANSSLAMLTIESRPKSGFDSMLETGGVAVHLVDQRPSVCSGIFPHGCPVLWRRQGQVVGPSRSYSHVLAPGETRTFYGLTISVNSLSGSGYDVSVSGTANIPELSLPG